MNKSFSLTLSTLLLFLLYLPLTAQPAQVIQKAYAQTEAGHHTSAIKTLKEGRKQYGKDKATKQLFRALEQKAEYHKKCAAAMTAAGKQLDRGKYANAVRLAGTARAAALGFSAHAQPEYEKLEAEKLAEALALVETCEQRRSAAVEELIAGAKASFEANDFVTAKAGYQAAREQMTGKEEYQQFSIDDRINEAHARQLEAIADGLVAQGDTTLALRRYNDARGMYAVSGLQAKVEGLVTKVCDEIPTDKLATSALSQSEMAKLLKMVGSQACNTFFSELTEDALALVEDLFKTTEIKFSDDPAKNEIYAAAATELVKTLLDKVKVE